MVNIPWCPQGNNPPLIIISARAFLQKTLPKRRFVSGTRVLRVGQLLDLDKTFTGWQDIGYEAVSVVEAPGQFSRRGGIIDIYPAADTLPTRIELFGDEVDTLRYFDPTTQRSLPAEDETDAPAHVVITPAREALPAAARAFAEVWQDEALPVKVACPPGATIWPICGLEWPRLILSTTCRKSMRDRRRCSIICRRTACW